MVHFLTHTIHFGLLRNHEAPVMLALIFGTSPSSFRHTPILRKQHKSINYGQENAGTSCLASKTGSDDIFDFTIVIGIPNYPLPEKTARIDQLQAGKCWHFLFGEQNRKWSHFELHHCVQHPYKPLSWENGIDPAINGRKTSCFWHTLTYGGSALFPFCPGNGHTDTIEPNFVWCVYITHDMKGGITPMK